MNWFIPAIFASLFWGVGQTLIKKGLTDVSPFMTNLLSAGFSFLLYVSFALIGGVNWNFFPSILLFGFLANLPNFIFPYVIEKADISLSGTVLATYPVYTIILSLLFLKESLNPVQVLGILAIITGMFLIAKPEGKRFKFSQWVIWAVIGAMIIGLGDFIGKVTLTRFDLNSFILAFAVGAIPSLAVFRLFDKSKLGFGKMTKNSWISVLGNLISPVGLLLLFVAFSKGPASLASPVASTYPVIILILAYFYLKEKITKVQLFGILTVTSGIVLVAI